MDTPTSAFTGSGRALDLVAHRLLSLGRSDPGSAWRANLQGFQVFLLLHVATRTFVTTVWSGPELRIYDAVSALTCIVALAGLAPNWRRPAIIGLACLVIARLVSQVAIGLDTANHVFLEGVLLGICAVCSLGEEDEAELMLQTLRVSIAIFFVWTGVQKVLYGYYFDGQYLAYAAATEERFHLFFQFLIPAEEMARLQGFNGPEVRPGAWEPALGAGPYRVDAPLFVAVSNLVYVFEIGAGLLLLSTRWRALAATAAIGFVIAIEAGARELTFGALMINLLLLFLPGPWVWRLLPLWIAGYGYLVLAEDGGLGWLPMFNYRA